VSRRIGVLHSRYYARLQDGVTLLVETIGFPEENVFFLEPTDEVACEHMKFKGVCIDCANRLRERPHLTLFE
jgi:hypothetical protein